MTSSFKIRLTIIFFIFILAYCALGINIYIIQIKNHAFYTHLAEQQYHVTVTQHPPRGPILDRTGKNYLAINRDYLSAFILPKQLNDPEATKTFLLNHFPDAYKRFSSNKTKNFMFIKRRLSKLEQELIKTSAMPDIFLLSEPGRYYPLSSAGIITGLTSIDNKGLFGLELLYESILAGKPTTYHLEKDARSGHYYFKKETTIQGDTGHPLTLTIDADLQFLTQEAVAATVKKFNAQQGAALVMNPQTGEIISLVSYPHFDPNNPKTASINVCKNIVISDAYELGSVIKIFAALAALEENVVTPDELIDCKNTLTTVIDGRTINTVKPHGIIPFTDVIAFSNNIGIATVAKRLDTKLYDYYKKWGFGTKTGIAFPGENPGFINPPEKWSKQSIISLSYGYEISATLLQLARAFSIIATGYAVTPHLVRTTFTHTNQQPLLASNTNLSIIKDILERTTRYGTAKRAAINGYRIMTKTGTANLLVDGIYKHDKNIYTSAGIVEKDGYQRVIVTFIKEAQHKNLYAATVAVPLFELITEHMLIHDKIIS